MGCFSKELLKKKRPYLKQSPTSSNPEELLESTCGQLVCYVVKGSLKSLVAFPLTEPSADFPKVTHKII